MEAPGGIGTLPPGGNYGLRCLWESTFLLHFLSLPTRLEKYRRDPMIAKEPRSPNGIAAILHARYRQNQPIGAKRCQQPKSSDIHFDGQYLTLYPNNTFVLLTILTRQAIFQNSEPGFQIIIQRNHQLTIPFVQKTHKH